MNKILFTAINNDPVYKDRCRVLLQSIAENAQDMDYFLVHALNCSEKFIQELQAINPKVKVIPQRYDKTKDKIGTEFNDNGKSYYTEMYRFWVFRDWLRDNRQGVIGWIDADVIVRKPLDDLFKNINPNTLKIWKRTTVNNPDTQMNIGVMVLGVSVHTYELILNQIELNKDNPYWGHSQKAIWEAYQAAKHKIEHQQLDPLIWNCRTFEDIAHVWHPTVNCIDIAKYKTEYNRLLEVANSKVEHIRNQPLLML